MNFFVGCGEVKLCLLLYVIVLTMLNNFFQNASLWFREDLSWRKSQDWYNFSLRETEYQTMANILLSVSIGESSGHEQKRMVPLDLNILQEGDYQIQQGGVTHSKAASCPGVAMEKSLQPSMPTSQLLHLKVGPMRFDVPTIA